MPGISGYFEEEILPYLTDEENLLQACFERDAKRSLLMHLNLSAKYEVVSATLLGMFDELETQHRNAPSDPFTLTPELRERLVKARKRAIFMAELYNNYMSVSRETALLRHDEGVLRMMLNADAENRPFEKLPQLLNPWGGRTPIIADWTTHKLRSYIISLNWLRLFINRGDKLAQNIAKFMNQVKTGMAIIEPILKPILIYVAWVFYIPRFLANLFLLGKHIWNPKMPATEKALGWTVRLQASFQRRWFDFLNDSVWLTFGVFSCFLLVGSLLPVAIYLAAALHAFDLLLVGIRADIELNRLYQLRRDAEFIDPDARAQLERRISFEQRRLYMNVGAATGLLLAVAMAVFLMTINPIIPLVGAILLVAITLIAYSFLKWNEKSKPPCKLSVVSKMGFFKAIEQNTVVNTDLHQNKPCDDDLQHGQVRDFST